MLRVDDFDIPTTSEGLFGNGCREAQELWYCHWRATTISWRVTNEDCTCSASNPSAFVYRLAPTAKTSPL